MYRISERGRFSAGPVGSVALCSDRRDDSRQLQVLLSGLAVFTAAALALLLSAASAKAHSSPSGWAYPYQCCHDRDCRPIEGGQITEGPNGYVIENTGEVVGYMDSRVRNSPDGEYHWCSIEGSNKTSTICLFVPPRSF